MSLPVPQALTRFDATAESYHLYRPSYPEAMVSWIVGLAGLASIPRGAHVVDVGCGTGIATRLFAARGLRAVGVDPSEEMLRFARGAGQAGYVRGQAEATGLASGAFDLVTAAQCFHWFRVEPTLAEFRRLLRPSGWCAAFWNLRASAAIMDEYDRLLRTGTSEYEVMARQDAAAASLPQLVKAAVCHQAEFENAQSLDFEGLLGRAYSSSCVRHGVADPATFERGLLELFDRHQRDGRVTLRYRTVAFCWQPAA